MEMILATLMTYRTSFISWWLLIAGITFLTTVVYMLIDDDSTLTVYEATKLSIVGIFSLLPIVRLFVPCKAFADFITRWAGLRLQVRFQKFAVVSLFSSLVLSPIAFVIVYVVILTDTLNNIMKCNDDV